MAGEMKGMTAAWRGALQDVPDRIQHCSRCKQESQCGQLPDVA